MYRYLGLVISVALSLMASDVWPRPAELSEVHGKNPSALFDELQNYQKTRDYCENLPAEKRPATCAAALEKIRKIEAELKKRDKDYNALAEQAMKNGKCKEAKDYYRLLMMIFPSEDDQRHRKALEKYNKLRC